jgi:hypothetical protein
MQSDDLTPAQAARLKENTRPMLGYLSRLKARMVKRRFHHEDPLLRAVVKAHDALHALNVEVHYRGDKKRCRTTNSSAPTAQSAARKP